MYGWHDSRDLGDHHHLDTLIWKDIVARLTSFCSISKISLGNGNSTAFWLHLLLGGQPLQECFPHLFSHSTRPNIKVAATLSLGLRNSLGPRLTVAATDDF
jgi:hypothetical protein